MKKLLYLCLILITYQRTIAQVKVTTLDKTAIPKTIKYPGHIINAVTYTDKDGAHLLFAAETGIVDVKEKDYTGTDEQFRQGGVYAYDYKQEGSTYTLNWKLQDQTIPCPVDASALYIPGTFAVTDIDNNGIAEAWLMYSTACRGDVSPASLKIIMHEGLKKYAVRGSSKVEGMPGKYYGGEYTFDSAFKSGPKAFRDYALALWKKNMLEPWK